MEWSPQQDAALVAVSRWLDNPTQQVFRFFGYAGTGKTTLAKYLAESLSGSVLFGAYTGKAAHVLRQKGCPGASTIHSMIYRSKEKSRARLLEMEREITQIRSDLVDLENVIADSELRKKKLDMEKRIDQLALEIKKERRALSRPTFELNENSNVRDAALIIIDECSMVDGRMGEDLLSFERPVLVLGDPAQLPPVAGAGFFTENVKPDVMLTEIHRQAKDNPIIHIATKIRQSEKIALGEYGSSKVVMQTDQDEVLTVDQLLVGRNTTRHSCNDRMRQLKGLQGPNGPWPVAGDRIVCLRNNHDKGLLNGAIWYVEDAYSEMESRVTLAIHPEDGGPTMIVEAHSDIFTREREEMPWWERKEAEEFDYGYALTVHKSQGSQWPNVLIFDESFCFREDRNRWLYTAVTRAAERMILVRT